MKKKKILKHNYNKFCNKHLHNRIANNKGEYNSRCLCENCYARNCSEEIKKEREILKDGIISSLSKLRARHHMETMDFDYLIRYIANF